MGWSRTPCVVRGSLRPVLGLNSPVALFRESALRVARESAPDMMIENGSWRIVGYVLEMCAVVI